MNAYEKIRAGLSLFATQDDRIDAKDALAELERAAAEPVAWMCKSDAQDLADATCSTHVRDTYARMGRHITPLYTTPPPAPATPDQTLSALTAYKAQQGDEYVRMQAALQAAGESK